MPISGSKIMKHPIALLILDGFGHSVQQKYNAIAQAKKPHINQWLQQYPHALLRASGTAVGLPDDCVGNSEVGHLTIGAGRVIQQPLTIINQAINDGTFFQNQQLCDFLKLLRDNGGRLHLIGLLSDAGVHGHEKHLYAFLQAAAKAAIRTTFIHPILDGRDSLPRSAAVYLEHLTHVMTDLDYGIIGSIHGRFYAMDRDQNWQRTQKSYEVLVDEQRTRASSWQELLADSYKKNITDEFVIPTQLNPDAIVRDHDAIIFCNIRSERAWQLTVPFVDKKFHYFPVKHFDLSFFATPINYHHQLHTSVLFPMPVVQETLKDILAACGKTIFSIAETEKYAHVTYFFCGEKDDAVAGETTVLVPSKIVKTYAQYPAMSAPAITMRVLESLKADPADFYVINYANADMVGHSGDYEATIQAIECLDEQLNLLYQQLVVTMDGILLITADHGKAEEMFDEQSGQHRTAHTNNLVPFLCIGRSFFKDTKILPLHTLADIAPFILRLMNIAVPAIMHHSEADCLF